MVRWSLRTVCESRCLGDWTNEVSALLQPAHVVTVDMPTQSLRLGLDIWHRNLKAKPSTQLLVRRKKAAEAAAATSQGRSEMQIPSLAANQLIPVESSICLGTLS